MTKKKLMLVMIHYRRGNNALADLRRTLLEASFLVLTYKKKHKKNINLNTAKCLIWKPDVWWIIAQCRYGNCSCSSRGCGCDGGRGQYRFKGKHLPAGWESRTSDTGSPYRRTGMKVADRGRRNGPTRKARLIAQQPAGTLQSGKSRRLRHRSPLAPTRFGTCYSSLIPHESRQKTHQIVIIYNIQCIIYNI